MNPVIPPSRRDLIQGLLAASAAATLPVAALPVAARAAGSAGPNFLFLTCFGGWDPTRTLVPAFDNPLVAMQRGSEPLSIGDLTVVDHPDRPSVRDFFTRFGDRVSVVHGMLVPSVAHMACLQLARTGQLSGSPDWPAIIAAETGVDRPLPHLAISGPSYPAELAPFTARTGAGGQLSALLDGSILGWGETPVPLPPEEVVALQASFVRQRREAALSRISTSRHRALLESHAGAEARVSALRASADAVDWSTSGAFSDDCLLAVEILQAGLARCVSVAHPALWDSHAENDVYQQILWEETFLSLNLLMEALEAAPGQQGGSLAEETVVVLMSEMGRSPQLNMNNGKDHWPYASAMLWGPGVAGGRAHGGYDEGFRGAPTDLGSGALSASGEVLSCGGFGATLLALADVDPGAYVPTDAVISSVLA